jgi:hypothetical protein
MSQYKHLSNVLKGIKLKKVSPNLGHLKSLFNHANIPVVCRSNHGYVEVVPADHVALTQAKRLLRNKNIKLPIKWIIND